MADDRLREVIQGLRSRLQDELEAQLEALSRKHDESIEEARRVADADAEQRLTARLEAANQEFASRLENELATVRDEAEKRLAAEAARVRLESTQEAAESAARVRREFEEALAEERRRAQQQLDAERERAQQQLDSERERARQEFEAEQQRAQQQIDAEQQRAQQELDAERQRAERELSDAQRAIETERRRAEEADTERRRAEEAAEAARQAAVVNGPDGARLLDAIRRLDEATSLSDVLTIAANAAAVEAPRATMFIVNTDHLEPWTVDGAASMSAGWVRIERREAGLLGDAIRHQQAVSTAPGGADAPAFAALPAGRNACAVPFVLGGQPVAVLYADEGQEGRAPAAWQDAIQILGRHASACVAHITAMRTTQAMRLLGGSATASHAGGNGYDEEQGARRYARLLVSEIKLYNESAVRLGRQKRDLLQRLRPEIDRARRLYDDRIPASLRARDTYFQQELVQTLADGDPALLG